MDADRNERRGHNGSTNGDLEERLAGLEKKIVSNREWCGKQFEEHRAALAGLEDRVRANRAWGAQQFGEHRAVLKGIEQQLTVIQQDVQGLGERMEHVDKLAKVATIRGSDWQRACTATDATTEVAEAVEAAAPQRKAGHWTARLRRAGVVRVAVTSGVVIVLVVAAAAVVWSEPRRRAPLTPSPNPVTPSVEEVLEPVTGGGRGKPDPGPTGRRPTNAESSARPTPAPEGSARPGTDAPMLGDSDAGGDRRSCTLPERPVRKLLGGCP